MRMYEGAVWAHYPFRLPDMLLEVTRTLLGTSATLLVTSALLVVTRTLLGTSAMGAGQMQQLLRQTLVPKLF